MFINSDTDFVLARMGPFFRRRPGQSTKLDNLLWGKNAGRTDLRYALRHLFQDHYTNVWTLVTETYLMQNVVDTRL